MGGINFFPNIKKFRFFDQKLVEFVPYATRFCISLIFQSFVWSTILLLTQNLFYCLVLIKVIGQKSDDRLTDMMKLVN